MGKSKNNLIFKWKVYDDDVIFIFVGMWYDVINMGIILLKFYFIYVFLNYLFGMVYVIKVNVLVEEY